MSAGGTGFPPRAVLMSTGTFFISKTAYALLLMRMIWQQQQADVL